MSNVIQFRAKNKPVIFWKVFFQLGHYNTSIVLMGADKEELKRKLPPKAIMLGEPRLLYRS